MRCKLTESANHLEIANTKNKYYIRLNAGNHPGVIGELGTICGQNNINLHSIIQKGLLCDNSARIVLLTESAYERDVQKALKEINEKPFTQSIRKRNKSIWNRGYKQ